MVSYRIRNACLFLAMRLTANVIPVAMRPETMAPTTISVQFMANPSFSAKIRFSAGKDNGLPAVSVHGTRSDRMELPVGEKGTGKF